ncbi:MAG: Ig-like domain-containing protein [Verrucomicrobiales bacterium]|nr:Ig-like domain-containing protein [Verrucomicrobiales bacterium]
MKYFLIVAHADGSKVQIPMGPDGLEYVVTPGDDIQLVDEPGRPVNADLHPDGPDLKLLCDNGYEVLLQDFYSYPEDADPILVTLNPEDIKDANYEFNAQVGNIPGLSDSSLMRFSNTGHIDSDDQFAKLTEDLVPPQTSGSSGIGGGGGSSKEGVSPLNASDDFERAQELQDVSIDLLANDNDPDASDNPLVIIGVTQPPGGTVVNNGTDVTFDPGTDESDTVTFTYNAGTPDGDTVVETVTLTVNGRNDVPDAVEDISTATANAAITVASLSNDSAPDAIDSLTITGMAQPLDGTAPTDGIDVTFDPGTDFDNLAVGETATVTFTYEISDGNDGTDTASVTITVNGQNDTPDAVNDAATTIEDAGVVVANLANDSAPDLDPVDVTSVTQPGGRTATFSGGDVTFDPGTDFEGLDAGEIATTSFTYDISGGSVVTDTATVTLVINGSDEALITTPDTATTSEDGSVTVAVLSNDSDPDTRDNPLTITGVTQPGSGTVTFTGTDATFDPGTDFDSLDAGETATVTFTYNTSDGNSGIDTVTVTITIDGSDDPALTSPDAATTSENATVVMDVLSNDSDPDLADRPLTVNNVVQPLLGSVVNNGTDVPFDPVNDSPDALNDSSSTNEDTAVQISVLNNDSDPENGTLSATSETQGMNGAVLINGNGGLDTATAYVNECGDQSHEGSTASWSGSNKSYSYNSGGIERNLKIDVSGVSGSVYSGFSGIAQLDPASGGLFGGEDDLEITWDPLNTTGPSTVTITLTFDEPVSEVAFSIADIDSSNPTYSNGRTDTITVSGTDGVNTFLPDSFYPDSTPPGFSVTGVNEAEGSITTSDDSANNNRGTVNVSFDQPVTSITISYDEVAGSTNPGPRGISLQDISWHVCPDPFVNAGPVAQDDTAGTDENVALYGISVLDTDSDADADSMRVVPATAANGTVYVNADGTLNYIPNDGFTGIDSVEEGIELDVNSISRN